MKLTINRRRFLKLAAAGGTLAVGGGILSACAAPNLSTAPIAAASGPSANFAPDVEIALRAAPGKAQILPGSATNIWSYQASVIKGDPNSVVALPDNYLGPIIRLKKGQKVRVTFTNGLPGVQPTTVHWHGLIVPARMDGHPKSQINPGQTFVYEFEVTNRAGTYWFHPHAHDVTPLQVNNGLAGLFLVSDDEQAALDLPSGEFDLPIVIQDRTFDGNNQFVYTAMNMAGMMGGGNTGGGMGNMPGMNHGNMGGMMGGGNSGGMGNTGGMMGGGNSGGMMGGGTPSGNNSGGMMGGGTPGGNNSGGMMGGMMEGVMGFLGQRILVNGKPDFTLPVATRAYRLRLLNGSNARIYKLAWSDGSPMVVIGTDGGLLDAPVSRKFLMLSPGERVELWADFSGRKPGDEITLESLKFDSGESMGGMESSAVPELGAPMRIMKVRVDQHAPETRKLPTKLTSLNVLRADTAVNAASPRQFKITLNGMQWLLNGRVFDMDNVADDEIVKLNTTEVWEFVNEKNPGAMMDQNGMPHPMHIHGVQFNVLSRDVLPELKPLQDAIREGLVDAGWKDTVLVMPGERVKVIARFATPGRFVVHCHNLEHESQGLMRNFDVRA